MIRRGATERLFVFAGRRPRLVFLLIFVVVAVAAGLAVRLRFDPDVLHLLPSKNPAVRAYREALEQFGSTDYFVAGVRIPEGAPLDPFEGYADRLAERMRASGLFQSVEQKLGEPEELLREFLPQAALFLDSGQREALAARVSDAAIERRVQELHRQLETPQAMALREILRLDPLGLAEVFADRLGGQRGPLAVDWTSGRYLSRDHRLLLVLGKPVRNPQDLGFNRQLVAAMDAAKAEVDREWREIAANSDLPRPETFWAGRYIIVLDDEGLIWRDVAVNAVSSVAGVLVLFYLAYRRVSLLALVFSPLFCGLAITFGFASVAVGVLASTTAGVAALLVGLGDDFVIVLYGRYVAERRRGASVEESLRAMGGGTARGVILGAITTAATFFAFLITDFTGLWQMGLIVGFGILFCLLAVLLLVPAMIGWSEEHHRKRETEPRLHIFAFGIDRMTRVAMRFPRATLALAAALTLVGVVLAPRLKFDDSVEALRPAGNKGILAQQEINQRFGSGFDHMSLLVEAKTLDETLALAERAAEKARAEVAAGRLGGVDAVTALLPPPERQREALAWLAAGRADGRLDPGRIRATFDRLATAEGLRPAAFAPGLDLAARALSADAPITRETLLAMPQGRSLLDRYLRQVDGGWRSVVKVYNLPGRPKREIPAAATELAGALGPQTTLTGMNVLSAALRVDIKRDAYISGAIGLCLVILLLWIDFRSLASSLLALVPLLVGILWMLAALVLFDFHLNFMNIFVITMILGVGVDYGIHVIHRYLEERGNPESDLFGAVEETARGVLLAALTTVVGFGSLGTSHYPGLVSMGNVATIGTLSTALVAILVVPAWLAWRHDIRPRERAPRHLEEEKERLG
ncbi:MAG: MMPL family transporter [Thermoanaerobaculia bacterium]